ncbi:hypothetical protein WKV44_00130 [Spirochaetia bacterium 38H-sp]|uniref:Uncharacterized protein n=1 Tax=Rarispira pelagica TaxID=3141764 RepID=A0ABU9UAC8_9SPIR
MKKKQRYAILLFYPDESVNTGDTVALSSFFNALPSETKAVWNIPLYPFLEEESGLSSFIGKRIFHGDMVISMGYSAAPLHLLTEEEARMELLWAAHNPWWTGLHDKLHLDLKYYLNPYNLFTDFSTNNGKNNFLFFLRDKKEKHLYLACDVGLCNPVVSLTSFLSHEKGKKAVRKLLSLIKMSKNRDSALVIRFLLDSSLVNQQALFLQAKEILEAGGTELVFVAPSEWIPQTPIKIKGMMVEHKDLFPDDYFAEKQRLLHENSSDRTREILRKLSPFASPSFDSNKPNTISLDANMQGQINLYDENLFVLFKEGLISHISDRQHSADLLPYYPRLEASSARTFNVASSFSIDEEGLRGLRTILPLFDKKAVLDMLMVEDFPHLIVDFYIPELIVSSSYFELRPFGIPFYAGEDEKMFTFVSGNKKEYTVCEGMSFYASAILAENENSTIFIQVLTPWGGRNIRFFLEKDKKNKNRYFIVPVIQDSFSGIKKKLSPVRISLIVSTSLRTPLSYEDIPAMIAEKIF